MKSFVSPDNIWVLWAVVTGWAAFSIYLEQKYNWASKVSGAIIALVGAMLLSNLNIIPVESVVYDQVWGYVVPLAIALLLYQCNIKKIWKESGRLLSITEGETVAANYWGRKEISLKDIAIAIGSAFIIVAVSVELSTWFKAIIPLSNPFLAMLNTLFGNQYLIITTLTMLFATFMPNFFGDIKGAQELGTFLIYIFFVVVGVPASITLIIQKSPLLLLYCGIMVLINMLVTFIVAKIFKFRRSYSCI